MIWIILLTVLAVIFWYKLVKRLSYWQEQGVKQTSKPWPLLGDMWEFTLKKITFSDLVKKIYNLYPNERYIGCYQYLYPSLLIRDPELIKQLTVKDFENFQNHRAFIDPESDPLLGGMLIILKGQKWREMRATLSGSFTSSKMKHIYGLMEETVDNFINFFLNKKEDLIEIELKDTFTRLTNDVIATSAFGIKCDSLAQPKNEFYSMGRLALSGGNKALQALKMFTHFVFPKVAQLLKLTILRKEIAAFYRGTIKETLRIREEKGIVRPDMINLLLEARKGIKREEVEATETGFATVKESTYNAKVKKILNLTDEIIISQAVIFFFAGFDTVSTAMCFGSYELAINKDIQDKLREEINDTYKKHNGKVTYDVLLKMKYLDMVVSEILRIWPPASSTDRECNKPYTIEPVAPNEKPVHLKQGDLIWIPIFAIHRDPVYYPNPDKFDPERFSDENKDSINPYTYMPFGVGPRNCIGSRFALLEIKVMLFNLLLNFEIIPTKKTKIPLVISTKSRQPVVDDGFWFAFKRIKNT